jgi:hypothetical protein
MKRIAIVFAALLLSVSAKAADFSMLNKSGLFNHKMEKCFCDAWHDVDPNEQQEADAKKFMDATKAVWDEHKADVCTSMKAVEAAWSAHPVSKDAVVQAEETLKSHLAPVMESARDSAIGIINLLSEDQHKEFCQSFKGCMNSDDDDDLRMILKLN